MSLAHIFTLTGMHLSYQWSFSLQISIFLGPIRERQKPKNVALYEGITLYHRIFFLISWSEEPWITPSPKNGTFLQRLAPNLVLSINYSVTPLRLLQDSLTCRQCHLVDTEALSSTPWEVGFLYWLISPPVDESSNTKHYFYKDSQFQLINKSAFYLSCILIPYIIVQFYYCSNDVRFWQYLLKYIQWIVR